MGLSKPTEPQGVLIEGLAVSLRCVMDHSDTRPRSEELGWKAQSRTGRSMFDCD